MRNTQVFKIIASALFDFMQINREERK